MTTLTREESKSVKKAAATAAETPESIALLMKDIENATGSIANTLENFKQVHARLLVIDGKNVVEAKFADRWQKLYDVSTQRRLFSQCPTQELYPNRVTTRS